MTCCQYGFAELSQFLRQEDAALGQGEIHAHLNVCPDCRIRLADLYLILAQMPQGLKLSQPPAPLRQQSLAAAFHARAPVFHSEQDEPCASDAQAPKREAQGPGVFRWRGGRWRFLTVTSVAVLGLATTVLSAQLMQTRRHVVELTSALAQVKVNSVALQPTVYAAHAAGKAIVEQQGSNINVYLFLTGARPTQGSQVYHVWVWNHGNRVSAGVFTVGSSGEAVFQGTVRGVAAGISGLGITLEPNAATKTPKGPKVFAAQL